MGMYRVEWPCCGSETLTDAWEPERCPFCEPDIHADPALLALARLGAWLAQSYAEESGGFDGPEIEDAEDRFGVVVLVKAAPGTCAGGKQYGDTCPCAEYYGSDEERECRLLAPGIADAIARLLAPDGAASEGVTG